MFFILLVVADNSNMVLYHITNIIVLIVVIAFFIYFGSFSGSQSDNTSAHSFSSSWKVYGWLTFLLYLCQYLSLLALPQALFNFFGFILFNPFPEEPKLEVWIKIALFFSKNNYHWCLIFFVCYKEISTSWSSFYLFQGGYKRWLPWTSP